MKPQATALAYAALLDRLDAADSLGRTEDVLREVGDLLGGLSRYGFAADLRAWLDGLEGQAADDAARDWMRKAAAIMRAPAPARQAQHARAA